MNAQALTGRAAIAIIRDRMQGLADMLKDIRKTLRVKKMDAVALESLVPGILPAEIPPQTFTEAPSPTNVGKTQSAILTAFRALAKDLFVTLHDRAVSLIARYQFFTNYKDFDTTQRALKLFYGIADLIEQHKVEHPDAQGFLSTLQQMEQGVMQQHSDSLLASYFEDTPLRRYLNKVTESLVSGEYFEAIEAKLLEAKESLDSKSELMALSLRIPVRGGDTISELHLPLNYTADEVAAAVELLVQKLKENREQTEVQFKLRNVLTMSEHVKFMNHIRVHQGKLNDILRASEALTSAVESVDPGITPVQDLLAVHDTLLANLNVLDHHDRTMGMVSKSIDTLCTSVLASGWPTAMRAQEAYFVLAGIIGDQPGNGLGELKKELDYLLPILEYHQKTVF